MTHKIVNFPTRAKKDRSDKVNLLCVNQMHIAKVSPTNFCDYEWSAAIMSVIISFSQRQVKGAEKFAKIISRQTKLGRKKLKPKN